MDLDSYRASHPGTLLRSAEECHYHALLVDALEDATPTLANVGRWAER